MNHFTIINKTTALLAKRNSGKSCLLKYFGSAKNQKFKKYLWFAPQKKLIDSIVIFFMMNLLQIAMMKNGLIN